MLSALGGLIADLKNDFIKTVYDDLRLGVEDKLQSSFVELHAKAIKWLEEDQSFAGPFSLFYSADMRYQGQSFEVETPLEKSWIDAGDINAIANAFHQRHELLFDHANPGAPIQVINLRLVIAGATPKPKLAQQLVKAKTADPETRVQAYIDGKMSEVPVYRREKLVYGASFAGPAIIGQDDCTTCVPEGFHTHVDQFGNLVINLDKR